MRRWSLVPLVSRASLALTILLSAAAGRADDRAPPTASLAGPPVAAGGTAQPSDPGAGTAPHTAPLPPAGTTNDDPVRFRFGIALDGDVLFAPDLVGAGAGLTVRLGVQMNQWVAVYYQPHGLVGAWLTGNAAGVIAGLQNTLAIELTVPFFQLAFGPAVDVLAVAGCGSDGAHAGCLAGDSVYFGLDARLALVLGAIGAGSRGGFSINIHAHPTFVAGDVVTTLAIGVGGEIY